MIEIKSTKIFSAMHMNDISDVITDVISKDV